MPAVVSEACKAVEIKHHAARVEIVEARLAPAIYRSDGHGTFNGTLRHHHFENVLSEAYNLGILASGKFHGKRHIGVVGEVCAFEHHCGTGLCILAAHTLHAWRGYEHIERINCFNARRGYEAGFVCHLSRQEVGNIHYYGMACHHRGVEFGFLVVEPYLLHIAEVIAHKGEACAKRSAHYQRVGLADIAGTRVFDYGSGATVALGICFGTRLHRKCHCGSHREYCILNDMFHILLVFLLSMLMLILLRHRNRQARPKARARHCSPRPVSAPRTTPHAG